MLVQEGLKLLRERDELRQMIAVGLEQAKTGRVIERRGGF